MTENWTVWLGFSIFVIFMLFLDLFVFHKKTHEIKIKEAMLWSAMWIGLALIFNYGVYYWFSKEKALEFFTAYVIEKSLSVDNLFVFIMIFNYFQVNPRYQHKILFWGIVGALVLRAIFIFAGVALIQQFHWIIYVFGIFLIYSGLKIPFEKEKDFEPDKNVIVRVFKKFMPVSTENHGDRLIIRRNRKLVATSLFIVLLVIEFSDLIFAVDSIPAVLAISSDTFIVYTSNVFAILGLRSLYFALAGMVHLFRYLKYGLAAILVFVGFKMCISGFYKMPTHWSLLVILVLLSLSVAISLIIPVKDKESSDSNHFQ
ncbi:MAG: TerC family protein [Bacteroidales bacterium]